MTRRPAPVHRALAAPADPLAFARALAGLPHAFLLGPAAAGTRSRWSFFGADPFAVFRGGDAAAAIAAWRELSAEAGSGAGEPGAPPFTGGAVGYWAYDYGRRLERLPDAARDDLGLPDFVLALHDVVGTFDHATGACTLWSSGLPERGSARAARATRRLEEFAARLASAGAAPRREAPGAPLLARSTFTPEGYCAAVERVRDHIRRGDIFQANLSQRWSVVLDPAPAGPRALALFESLATHSPAPYAAWLDCGDHAIASASPEGFLALRGGAVETRPIKGTRPRGAGAAEDSSLAAELVSSAKDRAENVMIVDVLRNDLGRACATGSVRVPELCALESFAQVHHLTSTVTGRLREDLDAFGLLHACFPGGSITGAPKIRAMEILDALEPVRRHVYTGAIGWLGWNGDAEWSIAIRTALVTAGAVHVGAGGGITADSDPRAEHEETLHKAEGLRLALSACFGETDLGARRLAAR